MNKPFIIKPFNELTTTELYEILKTRAEAFVVEQNCPDQDLDSKDYNAIHVFSYDDNKRVSACLRVFWKDEANGVAQIGRVVTLEHGKGLGGYKRFFKERSMLRKKLELEM